MLSEFQSGASSDGGSPGSPNGNYRSGSLLLVNSIEISNGVNNAQIVFADASGTLTVIDGQTLAYTASGDSQGASVTFSGTQTLDVLSANGLRLRILGTPPFTNGPALISVMPIHSIFNDVVSAVASSGVQQYRATVIQTTTSITAAKRWIGELGTHCTASAGLGGSGSGTIVGVFADWPTSGWVRIENSGGTLKEVAYYSSRSGTVLTVTSRARLGTSATAYASGDVVRAVPGIALAIDTNGITNFGSAIEVIADEFTAPAGVTWSLGITSATGLSIGTLGVNKQVGIWCWRDIPAGAICTANAYNLIHSNFCADQNTWYRIQNLSAVGYLVYTGTDALPDLTSGGTYYAGLPIAQAYALPGSGSHVLNVVIRSQNSYGLVSENQLATSFTLTPLGENRGPVSSPINVAAYPNSDGSLRVLYNYVPDYYPADTVEIWVKTTPPDVSVDSPAYTGSITGFANFGSYTPGTTYYVVVGMFRSADSVLSATPITVMVTYPALPASPTLV